MNMTVPSAMPAGLHEPVLAGTRRLVLLERGLLLSFSRIAPFAMLILVGVPIAAAYVIWRIVSLFVGF